MVVGVKVWEGVKKNLKWSEGVNPAPGNNIQFGMLAVWQAVEHEGEEIKKG